MAALCSVDGCRDQVLARSWCNTHYKRWRRHGDPLKTTRAAPRKGEVVCTIRGCEDIVHCRGWCIKHYNRWKKHGNAERKPGRTDEQRFWAKVKVVQFGCRLKWAGRLDRKGYGEFHFQRRHVRAHRYAYELLVGPIPEGLTLDHTCHNEAAERGECEGGPTCAHRACLDPDHLEPVTHRVNVQRGARHQHKRATHAAA